MIRVVLADDQELVREGLRTILEAEGDIEVAGEAADGAEAVRITRLRRPDVVVMDVQMPGTDGLAATRTLVDSGSEARVLVLTTFDLDEYVYEAMQAGASGFVLKTAPRHQLLAAVRTVADGDVLLAPSVTRRLIERFVRPAAQSTPGLDRLTDRELEVLALVGQGLTNAEIAAHLHLAQTTVKTHIGALLGKLSARDRVQLVITAYRAGLVEADRG
jgi:DNA-binding NarL/FixJ family response regulator